MQQEHIKKKSASYIQKSVQCILSVFTEVYASCQLSHMEQHLALMEAAWRTFEESGVTDQG